MITDRGSIDRKVSFDHNVTDFVIEMFILPYSSRLQDVQAFFPPMFPEDVSMDLNMLPLCSVNVLDI